MLALFIVSSALIAGLHAGCCELHLSKATCDAEVGQECVWLTDGDARIAETQSGTQQCMSPSLAECLQTVLDTGSPRSVVCPPAPVPLPGPTCEFAECQNDAVDYNILFILDESGSVGAYNYDQSVDFTKALIHNDVSSASAVSVYSFSNAVDTIYQFDEDQSSRAGVLSALENNKDSAGQYQGKCTDTLSALEAGIAEFENAASVAASDTNYLFLITDGVPYCGCGLSSSTCHVEVCGTEGASVRQRLADYGVRVYTMGIGNFDITRIECISDADDVFLVDGFTSDDFSKLEEQARPDLCPAVTTMRRGRGMILASVVSVKDAVFGQHLVMNIIVVAIVAMIIYGYCLNKNAKYDGYDKLAVDDAPAAYGSTGNSV